MSDFFDESPYAMNKETEKIIKEITNKLESKWSSVVPSLSQFFKILHPTNTTLDTELKRKIYTLVFRAMLRGETIVHFSDDIEDCQISVLKDWFEKNGIKYHHPLTAGEKGYLLWNHIDSD